VLIDALRDLTGSDHFHVFEFAIRKKVKNAFRKQRG